MIKKEKNKMTGDTKFDEELIEILLEDKNKGTLGG
jgi:hypothetical protein